MNTTDKTTLWLALVLTLLAIVGCGGKGITTVVGEQEDFYPPEILDKPLGVEKLSNGHVLITDTGGAHYTTTDDAVLEVDEAGNIVWMYVGEMAFPHSAERLSNGNTLISDTGNDRVFEVSAVGEIVWTSDDWGGGSGKLSDGSHLDYPNDAEELPNGHLLITDRNNDRVIEVDCDGHVLWTYHGLKRPHNADRLPNGNTIISNSEGQEIVEVDAAGNVVWRFGGEDVLLWPRDADRLPNGNTLITDTRHDRVIEVTPAGEIVWSFEELSMPYEADRLENGNTLIADNHHRRVIEVTPAGEVVWSFRNFDDTYPATLVNGGFEEDADGNQLPDGWYAADLNAEGAGSIIWDGEVRHSGKQSGKLVYDAGGRVAWLQTVTAEPGKTYELTAFVKTDIADEAGVAALQLWFLDEMGGPIGKPITIAAHTTKTRWTKDSGQATAPPEARAVQVWCLLLGKGTAWFDDVALTAR